MRELYNELNNKGSKNLNPQPTHHTNVPKPSSSSTQVTPITVKEYRKKSFFQKLNSQFQQVLRYEDNDLQIKVKSILPLEKLQLQAMEKLRIIQR